MKGNTLDLLAVICGITGAVEISFVESRIISKVGKQADDAPLKTRYWSILSVPERLFFWTGLALLLAPFLIAVSG